jgi:hypothetical protein
MISEEQISLEKQKLTDMFFLKKSFPKFVDYLKSLIEEDLNINYIKTNMSSKKIEFSFYYYNKKTSFFVNSIFTIELLNNDIKFNNELNSVINNKEEMDIQFKIISGLNSIFNNIDFSTLNSIFNEYIDLNENIKKHNKYIKNLENMYYESLYSKDKKSIDRNLLKVSKENTDNLIEKFSNKKNTTYHFITYSYKENNIIFKKSSISKNNSEIIYLDHSEKSQRIMKKTLNNRFILNGQICEDLKWYSSKNYINECIIDIKEFSKLYLIKDNIMDF